MVSLQPTRLSCVVLTMILKPASPSFTILTIILKSPWIPFTISIIFKSILAFFHGLILFKPTWLSSTF